MPVPTGDVKPKKEGPFFISVVCRARCLAVAVFAEQKVIELKRKRVLPTECFPSAVRDLVYRTVGEYSAQHIVVEDDEVILRVIEKNARLSVRKITVVEAKSILLPDEKAPALSSLYGLLLKNFDQLTRFVTLNRNGELSKLNDRRRLLPLLALGLGLADRVRYWTEIVGKSRQI